MLGLAVCAVAQRPEPNAFLNKPVHSVAELVSQMKADPVVMDRFMRHFGMTSDEVVAMANELHLAKMKKDTPMTVYNCNDRGVIGSKVFMIKAGALVFVDKYGTPILKKTCANPFFGRTPIDVPEVETEPVVGPIHTNDGEPAMDAMPMTELVEPPFELVPPILPPKQPRIEIFGTEDPFVDKRRRNDPWALLLLGGFLIKGGKDYPPVKPGTGLVPSPVPGPAAAIMFGAPAALAFTRRKLRGSKA